MAICYLIGAGDFGDGPFLPEEEDFVIAGDGGYRYCQEAGILPNLVIGDFDSLGYRPAHPHVMELPAEKDETDMWVAYQEGWNRGYRNFRIYGGTGGRISHTLANIQLLKEIATRGGEAELIGVGSRYRVLVNSAWEFPEGLSGYLSVFSIGGEARGVCEAGTKYTLEDAVLNDCFALGASNEFTGAPGRISVREGALLLLWEKDEN